MAKQLPKYEGLLNPQPIEIELRGRLPSYDVDKAIQKYPFSMDIPSIEELNEKKRNCLTKYLKILFSGDIFLNKWNWINS